MIQYFRPPMAGESVATLCKNCGYMGSGILAGGLFSVTLVLKNRKCPECKKKTLIVNPFVKY